MAGAVRLATSHFFFFHSLWFAFLLTSKASLWMLILRKGFTWHVFSHNMEQTRSSCMQQRELIQMSTTWSTQNATRTEGRRMKTLS